MSSKEPSARVTLAVGRDSFEAAESLWRRLEREGGVSPFQGYDWARVWLERLGRDCEPWLLLRDEPAPMLLPLVLRRRGGLRRLALMGQGVSDYLGPLPIELDPGTVEALGREIGASRKHFHVMQLQSWYSAEPTLECFMRALPGASIQRAYEICPWVDTSGSWDDYLSSRTRKFRTNLRRRVRLAEEVGSVAIQRESASAELFEELVDVERDSWKWEGGFAMLRDQETRGFLRALLLESQNPYELWTLRVNDELGAFALVFLGRETRYYYLPSFRARYPDVGTYLLRRIVEDSFESEFKAFDFLRGDEQYKKPWTTGIRVVHEVVSAGGGISGRFAQLGYKIRWRAAQSERIRQIRKRLQVRFQALGRMTGGSRS